MKKVVFVVTFIVLATICFAVTGVSALAEEPELFLHLTHAEELTSAEIAAGEDLSLKFAAHTGYALPEDIEVKIGGVLLANTEYDYDNGELFIGAARITASVEITLTAEPLSDISYTERRYTESLVETEFLFESVYYELFEEVEKKGTTGETVEAELSSIDGFVGYFASSATLLGDGTTVVEAYYKRKVFSLDVAESENGKITVATPTFKYGENAIFDVVPDAKYSIEKVTLNGVDLTIDTHYELMLSEDSTVSASFSPNILEGIEAYGFSEVYDGTIRHIVVSGTQEGDKILFSLDPDGEYSETEFDFKNVIQTDVYIKILRDNYFDYTSSVSVTITPYVVEVPEGDESEYVYSGNVQTYNLPLDEHYSVSGNERINAGSYVVEVALNDKDNYIWSSGGFNDLSFEFVIRKAVYDMSGVEFSSAVFVYDGEVKSVAVRGELPQGVTVTYQGNDKIDVGIYSVEASFTGDADNYELIPALTTTMLIFYDKLGKDGMVLITTEDGFDPRSVLNVDVLDTSISSVLRLHANQKVAAAFSLELESVEYEPEGRIYTVKTVIPSFARNVEVYLVNEEGVEKMDHRFENGYIIFNTQSLGRIAVVSSGAKFTTFIIISAVIIALLFIVGIVLLTISKKKMKLNAENTKEESDKIEKQEEESEE